MAQLQTCPDEEYVRRILQGQGLAEESEAVAAHLEQCRDCAERLDHLLAEDTVLQATQEQTAIKPNEPAVSRLIERLLNMERDANSIAGTVEIKSALTDDTSSSSAASAMNLDFLAASQADDEIGRLGPYRVLKLLGSGAMGLVFQAEDPALKRRVALKVMRPSVSQKPAARERFLREARAAAALEHENIVTIYQVGGDQKVLYLAMQWLKGRSLDELLERDTPMDTFQILHLGRQIAEGLSAAHAEGLIHRDIKPSNLWVEPERGGHIRVLDFGLARPVIDDVQLTQSGVLVGTPAYMAPEQARGETIDHRSDLFSLGVVLYRMATGTRPFRGQTTMAILSALALDDPSPPADIHRNVPPELSELIMELLAKEPKDRPASAREVSDRLHAIAEKLAESDPDRPDETVGSVAMVTQQQEAAVAVAGTERRGDMIPARAARAPRRRHVIVAAAIALLVFGPVAFFFGGVIVRFATNRGMVIITANASNIEVVMKDQTGTIVDHGTKTEYTVRAGMEHQVNVTVKDSNGQVTKFATERFTVNRGGTKVLTVELQRVKPEVAAKTEPAAPTPAAETAGDDRKIAEWVLSVGGKIAARTGAAEHMIAATADLPKEAFQLTKINLSENQISDADLKHLVGLPALREMDLRNTRISAKGYAGLKAALPHAEIIWSEPNRTAAHAVLSAGGTVEVAAKGAEQIKRITANDPLQDEYFQIIRVSLEDVDSSLGGEGGVLEKIAALSDPEWDRLETIDLSNTLFDDALLKTLTPLTGLTDLSLARTQITDAGLEYLKDHKNLRRLILDDTIVTTDGLDSLDPLPMLEQLSLVGTNIHGHILPHLARHKKLRQLMLARCVLGSLDVDPDNGFPELTDLNLRGTRFMDGSLEQLGSFVTLERLSLAENVITGASLQYLATLTRLKNLNLERNPVTDAGLKYLPALESLEELDLARTAVTDAGLKHLARLKNLAALDLTATFVTADGVKELQEALPDCKIIWSNHTSKIREVAQWLLSVGGKIDIRTCEGSRLIANAQDLPVDLFYVTGIDLGKTSQVDDADLARLEALPELRGLKLAGAPITDAGAGHLAKLPHLTSLDLSGTKITDSGLECLNDLTELRYFSMVGSQITGTGLVHWKCLPALRRLVINDSNVTDAGLKSLEHATNLEHLNISSTSVSDLGLVHLRRMKKLECLGLGRTQVSNTGLKYLTGLTSLKTIDLTNNLVDDAGVSYLLEFQQLRTLGLNGTRITDAGLEQLVSLQQLEDLDLGRTRVSDAGLKYLLSFPLQKLNVLDTRISAKGYADLKAAFPVAKIFWSERNRTAAAAILDAGGTVDIAAKGSTQTRRITSANPLPDEYFQVVRVSLADIAVPLGGTGGVLEKLADLSDPVWDRVRSIDFSGSAIEDNDLALLQTLPTLEQVSLTRTRVGDAGLTHLGQCKSLRHVVLDDTRITDTGLDALKELTELEEISVANTRVDDRGLKYLAKHKTLHRIVLDGCPIRGGGMTYLKDLPGVIELRVGSKPFTDLGVELLDKFVKLECLSLAGSATTDAGLEHLAGLKCLKELDLTGTPTTAAGVEELQRALPGCKIIRAE